MSAGARLGRWDAVVVGGGHNGLVAAAYMARAGRSCLVIERSATLGGAAVSAEAFSGVPARLSRYAYLVSLLPELIVEELGLPLRLARRAVSSYTPDPRSGGARGLLVDDGDAAATERSFAAVSDDPSARAAWRDLYEMTGRVAAAVFPTMTCPLPSREQLRAAVGPADWEAIFERPIGETVRERLGDELLAGVALTDALIGTFAEADGADLLANRCFLYHVIGRGSGEWLVPLGGMGALADALADAAVEAGAELRTGVEAVAIEAAGDGAEIVCREEGRETCVGAGVVLFGAAPSELARLTGTADTAESRPEGCQLKVNLLLRRLPRLREPALAPERAFAGTFHVNETASQLQAAYERAAAGELPDPVPCEAYCHSLTDPSILAPDLRAAGAHTLTVFALHTPARLFAADPDGARERALAATLASLDCLLAEPLEGCLMHDGEGRPCVEARSPLDLERELRMPGGHIFHRDLSWPFAEDEDDVGTWGVESGIPSVLLCGAGARRGGGVSGIPGRNAAMAALGL
ncbi:MAG TPA: NAD(P)/FAD-dependent oxidoreductase [Solirubrobacteraceae bacterium]